MGDVHEPNKVNHSIGAFIVGDAVTRAATYETMGKGMRVFTDADSASYIRDRRHDAIFKPLVNPLVGDTVDEWQWYAPGRSLQAERNVTKLRSKLNTLVGCHTMLRYSPKFAWNATTPEGCRQLACSIVAVSNAMERVSGGTGTYRFTVEHLLLSNQNRCDKVQARFQERFVHELLETIRSNQAGR